MERILHKYTEADQSEITPLEKRLLKGFYVQKESELKKGDKRMLVEKPNSASPDEQTLPLFTTLQNDGE